MTHKKRDKKTESQKGFEVAELFNLKFKEKDPPKPLDVQTLKSYEIGVKPIMNMKIVEKIEKKLGLGFESEPEGGNVCFAYNNAELRDDFKQVFSSMDLLNYTFAVLNAPAYQTKYQVFLKMKPLRAPYPEDIETFWKLVHLGNELRQKRP